MSTVKDPSVEAAKRTHAGRIIAERNQISSLLFFAFFCCVLFATPFFPRMPTEIKYFGAAIFTLSLVSFFLSVTRLKFFAGKAQFLRFIQSGLIFTLAVVWSALCLFIMKQYSLGWASFFVFLVSLSLSAIHLSTLQPSFVLLCVFQAIILLPISFFALFKIGSQPGHVIGWFFLGVYVLNVGLGFVEFKQFWKTESDRSLLQAIFDSLPGTIARIDTENNYIDVNQRYAELFEASPGQFQGKQLGFREHDGAVAELVKDLVEGEKERQSRLINIGQRVYFVSAQKYNFNKEVILLGVEMTDQFLVQDQLEFQRAQTMNTAKYASLGEVLSLFAGDVSAKGHQFLEKGDNSQGLKESLKVFSQIHALSQSHQNKDKISTLEISNELKQMTGAVMQDKGIEIGFSGADEQCLVEAKREDVLLIALNLLHNSMAAVTDQKQAKINVAFAVKDDQVQIRFSDSGEGVPEYLKEVVFEPSYTTKEASQSTGVGLSVSKSLAEKNSGTLGIEGEGQETVFVLQVPKSS